MIKVLIFGTGGIYSILKQSINMNKVEIVAFIDDDTMKHGTYIDGIRVVPISEIENLKYEYVIIASGNYDYINERLEKYGVEKSKIIATTLDNSQVLKRIEKEINKKIDEIANFNILSELLKEDKKIEGCYNCNMPLLGRTREFNFYDYNKSDYVRMSSIELIAYEINSKKIKGCVAELGVYKGDFAKIINKLFPERKLYLFDTFSGFDMNDICIDKNKKFSTNISKQFSDCNLDSVISNMEYPENCIIRKGYFPKTAENLQEKYVFVSIDADLYKPIYDGLEYFYKNLVHGGYIIVHDYNNAMFKGAKSAVIDFCQKYNIGYVPLSDVCGSVVITK
ncbi:hypothetical protein UT300007_20520 [Clostridium sp. CTA-7]